jgi:chromosome segregation ATPase
LPCYYSLPFLLQEDKNPFKVTGKGYTKDQQPRNDPSNLSSPQSSSRPLSRTTTDSDDICEFGEPLGSFQLPTEAMELLQNVMRVNKDLDEQVVALRLRIDVEQKNQEAERKKTIQEKDRHLKVKEHEIGELTESISVRDYRIRHLNKEKEEQSQELLEKIDEIAELKCLVEQTEGYAKDLNKKVSKLREEKRQLESGSMYKSQNEEIRKLKNELHLVKDKLDSMQTELSRARNIIEQQNSKIRNLEYEKGEMNVRFREDLEKASRAMRQEVERMREVMKQQYEEMKNLRVQNLEISSDVRDIKELLLKNTNDSSSKRESLDINRFPIASRSPKPSVRSSMPNMKGSRGASNLPPLEKEQSSGSKWIPAGTRRSMNKPAKLKMPDK